MESRNYLGIYWREHGATVVCLAGQGRDRKLLDCFSVSTEGQDESDQAMLVERIIQACAERNIRFADVRIALDAALFMQHTVHSDFADPRKIATTIRFDTEEVLATDVSEMAVAFRIIESDGAGSNLDVFTAQRGILSEILVALQGHGIDPITVAPDVCCLSRYLGEYGSASQAPESSTLYALLSDSRGYLVTSFGADGVSNLRTFVIGATQDKKTLLARETLVATGLTDKGGSVGRLCIADANDESIARQLVGSVSLPVENCDLAGMAPAEAGQLADCANMVDFALACGAALGLPDSERNANFRNDHMPYQGKKIRQERAVRFLSISLAVLLLAIGIYFQSQVMRVNRYQATLRSKFEPDYLAVMLGHSKLPGTMKKAVTNLDSVLRRLRNERMGGAPKESISAKLILVLQALNSCAGQTDLNIDVVTITSQNIILNGDTASRRDTLKVFDAMDKAGLNLQKQGLIPKDGRDTFQITVQPGK